MVISNSVHDQFFGSAARVIRVESSQTTLLDEATLIERRIGLPWTAAEHERFLRGLELYPRGPWKLVADYVGTRTTRQTMTHAQKYRQRIGRQLHRKEKEGAQTYSTRVSKARACEGNSSIQPTKRLSTSRDQQVPVGTSTDTEFNTIWDNRCHLHTMRSSSRHPFNCL